jgi:hypothetical protein
VTYCRYGIANGLYRPIAVLLECYGIDVVCEMTPSNHMLSTICRIGIGLKQGSARAKRCRVALSAAGVYMVVTSHLAPTVE